MHLPDGLWRSCLRDFVNGGGIDGGISDAALVILDVAILEDLGVATKEGIVRSGRMNDEGGSFCRFIYIKERNGAKARHRLARAAGASSDIHDATVVTVIEENQREFAGRVGGGEGRAVLCVEPVLGVGVNGPIRIHQGEITLIAETPEDISGACAIVVVNFYQ